MSISQKRLAVAVFWTACPAMAAAAPVAVRVERAGGATIGSRTIYSSTALVVSWVDGDTGTHHFEIVATEQVQGAAVRVTAPAGASQATLGRLKSHTTYRVVVRSCRDETCAQSSDAEAVSAETDREHWQLYGSGNTVSGLARIVSDGNARLSATRFGPDAGEMANRVQLYYGPMGGGRQSPLAVAVSSGPATAANPESYLSFSSRSGSSGLVSPGTATPLVQSVATGQGVPLARERGALVRLFFEAQGADGRTRVLAVDSKDGYYGQDFNAGPAATCSTAADYAAGGGCEPTVVIAVDGDAGGNRRVANARQHKVAWPTLDSPHWDLAAGTFLVFTTDRVSGCSDSPTNHGYAVWNGAAWVVQYHDDGCPKLFKSAQAASPFHDGGSRYRLYYGDPSMTEGRTNSSLPFLGPKQLIYADGSVSGQADAVDFEDWESQASARDVVFLWPNGEQLDARAEGYIDDYHFLAPTGSLDLQVMYITITDGAIPPIAVAARLLNP